MGPSCGAWTWRKSLRWGAGSEGRPVCGSTRARPAAARGRARRWVDFPAPSPADRVFRGKPPARPQVCARSACRRCRSRQRISARPGLSRSAGARTDGSPSSAWIVAVDVPVPQRVARGGPPARPRPPASGASTKRTIVRWPPSWSPYSRSTWTSCSPSAARRDLVIAVLGGVAHRALASTRCLRPGCRGRAAGGGSSSRSGRCVAGSPSRGSHPPAVQDGHPGRRCAAPSAR